MSRHCTHPCKYLILCPRRLRVPSMFHLRMVSSEQFAALREHISQSGFNESALRQRFDVPPSEPLNLVPICTKPALTQKMASSLDAIIHLFLVGETLPTAEAQALFPPAVWEAFTQSELILVETAGESRCLGSVALFPVRGLFCVADRWTNIDHTVRQSFPDIVYPPMTKSVKEFLDYTSFEACEDFLEVCAGTAPAALLAAKSAKNVWATDITERSLAFAEFNAALNGIHNVKFGKGDLFQPVAGRKFDRIAAHPPYMPSLRPTEIFAGGGELGEYFTKRIVSELPAMLKTGGRLYCRTLGLDRFEKSFEKSVREWLGEKQAEFDVAVFVIGTVAATRFALEDALRHDAGTDGAKEWEKLFETNGVRELLNSELVIQHNAGRRPPFTLRRVMPSNTSAATVEWFLRWEAEMRLKSTLESMLESKPSAIEGTEVTVRQVLRDGELIPEEFKVSVKRPFEVDFNVQPWMTLLLASCDGKNTVVELHELSKQNEWIAPQTPVMEFCGLLATLISVGFLQTEKIRWPVATE
jgi:SAM-dependent methyltransferase